MVKYHTVRDNEIGYKPPFIPLMVAATCNILNHTPIYSITYFACIVVYHFLCLRPCVDERIPTDEREYGCTLWPIWVA